MGSNWYSKREGCYRKAKEIMKLGFYYHIPLVKKGEALLIPSYIGVFIKSLAAQVEELVLFLHHSVNYKAEEYDMDISGANISWVDMGPVSPAWRRGISPRSFLKRIKTYSTKIDQLLVRAPSPLAPAFPKYFPSSKIAYLIVGSYRSGAKEMTVKSIRDWAISQFLVYNQQQLERSAKTAKVLVNSVALQRDYQRIGVKSKLVKTTTISRADLFEREDSCQKEAIHLLYTGRIDLAKGLVELLMAVIELTKRGRNIILNIVGWEPGNTTFVTDKLRGIAKENGIEDRLIFHGKKSVGEELNAFYRKSDIYLMPSHHEGFPRTIWEALANSLPVVATKVGSIPHYLQHKEHSLLIEPKNIDAIVKAIEVVLDNPTLRRHIIRKGHLLSHECLLEYQTKVILNHLKGTV